MQANGERSELLDHLQVLTAVPRSSSTDEVVADPPVEQLGVEGDACQDLARIRLLAEVGLGRADELGGDAAASLLGIDIDVAQALTLPARETHDLPSTTSDEQLMSADHLSELELVDVREQGLYLLGRVGRRSVPREGRVPDLQKTRDVGVNS